MAIPEGTGPWPGIVMYPDAGGVRAAFRDMAARLAGLGYVVLLPDVYYRHGQWAPFDMKTAFTDDGERQRLFSMLRSVTPEAMETDARPSSTTSRRGRTSPVKRSAPPATAWVGGRH